MFREMRRKKQILPLSEVEEILTNSNYGVLAVSGDEDYPYAVPLNYVYWNNSIYIHCALTGHKIDGISRNSKVSFCVVGYEKVIPEHFTSHYKSVIVFGKATIVTEGKEKMDATVALSKKYSPNESDKSINNEIEKFRATLNIVRIDIDHISGKQCKELIV